MLQLWSEMARRKGAWEAFSCVVGEHTDAGGKKREKERKCCDVSMRDQTAESEWQLSKVWGLSLEQIDLACQSERSFSSIRQRRDKKKKRGRRGFHLFLISLAGCKRRRIAGRSRRKASQVAWVLIARPLSGRHVTILSILAVSPPILFFFCFFFLCRVSQQQSKSFRLTRNFAYKRPLISAGNYFLPLNGYSALSFTGRRARDREFQQLPLPFLFSLYTLYFIQNFVSIRKISNWLCAISEMGNWWLSFPSGRRIWARSHSPISNSDLFEWFRLKQQITQSI